MLGHDPKIQIQKTITVVGISNLSLSPLFLFNNKPALGITLLANTLLLAYLHGLGKGRRIRSNSVNRSGNFFSRAASENVVERGLRNAEKSLENIITGGEILHDDFSRALAP